MPGSFSIKNNNPIVNDRVGRSGSSLTPPAQKLINEVHPPRRGFLDPTNNRLGTANRSAELAQLAHPPSRIEALKAFSNAKGLQRAFMNDSQALGKDTAQNLQGVTISDVERMKHLYDLRRGVVFTAKVPPFQEEQAQAHAAAPHDPTEDPIEHIVMTAEMAAGGAEGGIMGFQLAVGKMTVPGQASEVIGSLFGLLPELMTLRAQNKQLGHTIEAQNAEIQLRGKISEQVGQLHQWLVGEVPLQADAVPRAKPDFDGLRQRLGQLDAESGIDTASQQSLTRALTLLEQLYDGQSISQAYFNSVRGDLQSDRVLTKISLAGGGIETVAAAMTTAAEIGEHSVPQLVGAMGYGAGALGGAITLPFTAKFLRDNARAITPHKEAARSANQRLKHTAEQKTKTMAPVSRPGALRRAMAKLALKRSEPGGKKFKTGVFGVALMASLTNIAGGVAAAAGALVVAGTLAAVGTVIGLAALTGIIGYTVYKSVQNRAANRQYRVDDLKKVITNQPNPISGPLMTRQRDKLLNHAFMASCEEFSHAAINKARPQLASDALIKFDEVLEAPLKKHALALLKSSGPYGDNTLAATHAKQLIETIEAKFILNSSGQITHINGPLPWESNISDEGETIGDPEKFRQSFQQAVSEAMAITLRSFNQDRVALINSPIGFSNALDRIEDEFTSTDYRVTTNNRRAVAAALAQAMPNPEPLEVWANSAKADPANANMDLNQLIDEQGGDLARASALRKLLRRDPEALLLTYVQTLRDAKTNNESETVAQLLDDLRTFGVQEETLGLVQRAQDDKQMFDAVGLLAKQLKFMS
jgi:hypothetical protein